LTPLQDRFVILATDVEIWIIGKEKGGGPVDTTSPKEGEIAICVLDLDVN